MERIRTLILGAAGRDFHNFNVVYRDDTRYEVVGFTAAQIPTSPVAAIPQTLPARSIRRGWRSFLRRTWPR
jgi:predicted GTPase